MDFKTCRIFSRARNPSGSVDASITSQRISASPVSSLIAAPRGIRKGVAMSNSPSAGDSKRASKDRSPPSNVAVAKSL